MSVEVVFHLIHQPHGRRGGSADANVLFAVEPAEVDFGFVGDEIAERIHSATFLVENSAVAAFAAAYKQNHVVVLGKLLDLRYSVSHATAYGVEAAELHVACHAMLYFVDNFFEAFERLGGLRI